MEISWLINASWIQNRVVIYRGPLKFWRINHTNLNSKIVVFFLNVQVVNWAVQ